ncbi:triphosphoribosyl-dephospho-CoA synthase [Limnobacter parvus]|uniref:triphosphoribosyl-dephospho-CoA synthase n=1 Tax=Limnobacter parvus TaxID=2939690 RepID=A0ABT1XJL6_9BURK|nr:triphosphoribosyl-dephospho-CoA synthase [Limnobacter parvus]MCR2747472.1 triphosphoribosyl-dephospho-CoA synthase [Limnobacter parvus]
MNNMRAQPLTQSTPLAQQIDDMACIALAQEVQLELKPGLVCPGNNGSHSDMNCNTFHASIHALKGYFGACFQAGYEGKQFRELQVLGMAAEKAMFNATHRVNTHKGAIFLMGLLAGAAGAQYRDRQCFKPMELGRWVAQHWGANILLAGVPSSNSNAETTHGRQVKDAFGLPGAREQAAQGFPVLFWTTVPQLRWALLEGLDAEAAQLHALVCTIAQLPDTNLAHRGGLKGLQWAQARVEQFLAQGGVFSPSWRKNAQAMCAEFKAQWLSPGGSADLLSAALFIQSLSGFNTPVAPRMAEFNR